ncbi:glycosyltransferase [Alphaproteobacteria bacterium KMM 3653]|uniref:Glycosyltransferase n=1 Tax=Harenicola maris TaxID=2841044 RepID=A0AAP2CLB9_9RHOB|nr:glycosyltransferase [Harenicola maris]
MNKPRIIHLVDDTTAGGVTRVLDHLLTAPALGALADHSLQVIDRKSTLPPRLKADVIVSHLAISWRLLPMLALLRLCHPKAALVHVEHSYTQGFVAENVPKQKRFYTLLRRAYALFDRVVAVSEAQGDWLVGSTAVKPGALQVICSCVDLSDFRAIEAPQGKPRVIGAIGRLDRQKGFDTLIKAFTRIPDPDISLHIFGEGEEEPALRALAKQDSRIHFRGFTDPIAAMEQVDAVAMPSRWEAYGIVAVEALSAQRQLLVNTQDGLQDHIPYGALAVPDDEVATWKQQIEMLTLTDPATLRPPQRSPSGFETQFARGWRELLDDILQGEACKVIGQKHA